MQYISPFILLDLNNGIPDKKEIIQAKKKILAEFELNEGGIIEIHGYKLDKTSLVNLIDETQDEEKLRHHYTIYKNVALLEFLHGRLTSTKTKVTELSPFTPPDYYEDKSFVAFVEPYFRAVYSDLLLQAIKNRDDRSIFKLVQVKLLSKIEQQELCFNKAYNYLLQVYDDLKKVVDSTTATSPKWEDINVFYKGSFTSSLNLLPAYFLSVRDKFAQALMVLSVDVYNIQKKPQLSLDIITAANALHTSGSVKNQVNEKYNEVNNLTRDLSDDESYGGFSGRDFARIIFVCIKIIVFLSIGARGCSHF